MLELLFVARSHPVILTSVQLVCVFAVVKVVGGEGEPCEILVGDHGSGACRVA